MPVKPIKTFLDKENIKYVVMAHSPAFTAQEIAAAAHISGRQLAKTVIVKIGDKFSMVVVSANDHVNFGKLKEALGVDAIDLASESEFKDKFPGCEVGAMPPFGNLYDMQVFVEQTLSKQDHITFNAGSHAELLQLAYRDFERLVKPKVVVF